MNREGAKNAKIEECGTKTLRSLRLRGETLVAAGSRVMNTETVFRIITALLFITALFIGGSFRRKAEREGGALRTPAGNKWVVLLRLMALVVVLPLFGYWINPSWVAWARVALPDWPRWIATGVAVALLPMMVWVFTSIGKNISTSHDTRHGHVLVTHGPYRWVRHPLYSVGFLFAVALTVIAALWWLAVGMILPLFALLLRTGKEEEKLVEAFGDEYRDYMKRTGRFLPRLSQ
ncbi:MAG: isoprenylcysteine carboxylmethyltransferase family protein [Chloroflexi bacterium]|nr:isoprenylcysteine carboxylmethyltransferase family protein [Chloroflexota bacterium]